MNLKQCSVKRYRDSSVFLTNIVTFVLRIVSLLVSVTSRARLRHSWISPLHLAAEHNRHAVAAVLLKTGADVNATLAHNQSIQYADGRSTALYFAIANGSTETAEVLLNAGASVSLDPISPLLMAVRQGCVSTVSLLLDRGADIEAKIPSYTTTFPAVIALCMNNLPLLKCLLDNGCDACSCFTCTYSSAPHPPSAGSHIRTAGSNGYVLQNDSMLPLTCCERTERAAQVWQWAKTASCISHQLKIPVFLSCNWVLSEFLSQFCEWISMPVMCKWAGPIIDLLLEHVGQVQLCSKLTELLDSREEWLSVKRKSRACQIFTYHLTYFLINLLMQIRLLPLCLSLPHMCTYLLFLTDKSSFIFSFCPQCRLVHCSTCAD